MTTPVGRPTAPLLRDRVVFAAVVLASVVVLFVPSTPGPPLFPYADKVIHLVLFAALTWSGRRAGFSEVQLVAALVGYAALSELVQAVALRNRSGGYWDLVADVLGVALGLLAARAVPQRQPT